MAFTRVNASGWALNDPITPDQINNLDIDHANAIDGAAGGSYAPSSQIIIGGSGFRVTGPFDVTGLVTFTGSFTVGDTAGDAMSVFATATFQNNLTVLGNTTLGDTAGDTLTVVAQATFQNTVVLGSSGSDTLTVNAETTFFTDVHFSGGTGSTIAIPLTLGTGAAIKWRIATGGDAPATYHPANYDVVIVPAATLATGRTYTLGSTGAYEGVRMLVITYDSGFTLTVDYGPGTQAIKNAAGNLFWYAFYYRSGAWTRGEAGALP